MISLGGSSGRSVARGAMVGLECRCRRDPDSSFGTSAAVLIFHSSPNRADTSLMLKPMVEVKNEGGVLVAEFWDCLRLDPNPVRDLRQHYEAHVRSKGKPDLVVDLNGVIFAGSAALGGFLSLNRLARQQGGRVVFCNVDENVHEVFRISKLTPMFVFVEDRPAALAFLIRTTEEPTPLDGNPPVTGPSTPTPPTAPRPDGPLRRMKRRDP